MNGAGCCIGPPRLRARPRRPGPAPCEIVRARMNDGPRPAARPSPASRHPAAGVFVRARPPGYRDRPPRPGNGPPVSIMAARLCTAPASRHGHSRAEFRPAPSPSSPASRRPRLRAWPAPRKRPASVHHGQPGYARPRRPCRGVHGANFGPLATARPMLAPIAWRGPDVASLIDGPRRRARTKAGRAVAARARPMHPAGPAAAAPIGVAGVFVRA